MEKIKRLRQECGVSQKELADKINVHKTVYSQMENGKLIPNNKEEKKAMAVDILYPLLIKKIIAKREELESLENFSLQFKSKQ